ncbi:hypothetical protein MKY84_11285 [Chryseomicrobium sp. FSL W7-1435]|uniref:hypothetical protein n=1 Tax=Chryseomicrobium sp. FSL W7-1435 TaxID=2921704 RepID=UPI00315A5968
MKHVVKFMVKDWLKTKLLYIVVILLTVFVGSLLIFNQSQSGTTLNELKEFTQQQIDNVVLISSTIEAKEAAIGAPENELKALEPLYKKEEHLRDILTDLNNGNYNVAEKQIAFYKEYKSFTDLKTIYYLGQSDGFLEKEKALILHDNELGHLEETTPYDSALFTNRIFELLFNPLTVFFFLLIFSYRYINDRENRTFDFLKLQSLSNKSIYFGYFLLLVGSVLLYAVMVITLAFLPVILSGSWESINYPVEVLQGTEVVFIPVWKWLLYRPLGWLIFMTLSLLFFTFFVKQQAAISAFAITMTIFLATCYFIYTINGFQLINPLHLIAFYEGDFFIKNSYLIYLGVMMLFITLIGCGIVYFISSRKIIKIQIPVLFSVMRERPFYSKWTLLQFEFRKKKRKRHIAITLTFIFVSFSGVFFYIQNQVQSLPKVALELIDEKQQFITTAITNTELNHENHTVEIETMKQTDEKLNREPGEYEEDLFLTFLDTLKEEFKEYEKLKTLVYNENFPQLFNDLQATYGGGGSYKDLDKANWTVSTMASEEQRHILERSEIDSWPFGVYWISHFDDPSLERDTELVASARYLQTQNQKYDSSSQFMLYKFFEWNLMWLILFAFVAFLWTTISEERTPQSTISFLSTKPLSFQSVYASK